MKFKALGNPFVASLLALVACLGSACNPSDPTDPNDGGMGDAALLSVTLTGNGMGTVISQPAGIQCGTECQMAVSFGDRVTLVASPHAGSTFSSWGGDCAGNNTATCTLTLSGDTHASAEFAPMPAHTYSVAVEPTSGSATTLGTQISFAVTVSANQFSGAVSLSATGALTGWDVTFSPSTVSVADGAPATAVMTISIPSNGEAAPFGAMLTVKGDASIGQMSASTTLTVANEFLIPIADGTGNGAHFGALAGTTVHIKPGIKLRFMNFDTVSYHQIHASSSLIPHQSMGMSAGMEYSVTVNNVGGEQVYCHAHGSTLGAINFLSE